MKSRPNILLLVSDQHSNQVMGCAGDPVVRTPNLDGLAEGGALFESCQCAAPICVPSRMTMMTGRQCSDIEVWSNRCQLASDIPTFAHALGAAGYETVLAGRMHFLGPDQRHGFHRRILGALSDHRFAGGPAADLGDIPLASTGQCRTSVEVSGPGRTSYQAFDENVAEVSGQFLREHAGADRPFLLTAGFVLPHCPFIAPRQLYEHYRDAVDMPELPPGYLDELHPAIKTWREVRGVTDLTEEEIRGARAGYYGLVEHFDAQIGRVLAALDESGLREDTVVIYVSDHGESAGRNGLWWKSQFYDHSVGVPMIISAPGLVPRGEVREEVVSLTDLAPTLTDLADAPELPSTYGQSLLPLLTGTQRGEWRDEAFAELIGLGDNYRYPARMIRRGPWKLMHYEGFDPLLFNLEEDPDEFHDLAQDPQCRDIRRYLHDRVRRGWDPQGAMARMRDREEGRSLRTQWREAWDDVPDTGDHWPAPEGSNEWPV